MPKNEFWALSCTCEDSEKPEASPMVGTDESGQQVIPIYPTKELAQIAASNMFDCERRHPRVVKIKAAIIERI